MKNTNTATTQTTKTIKFREYTYVLYEYKAEVNISLVDFKKLESDEINIEDIKDKYYSINYDDGKDIDTSIDSYKYDGEV